MFLLLLLLLLLLLSFSLSVMLYFADAALDAVAKVGQRRAVAVAAAAHWLADPKLRQRPGVVLGRARRTHQSPALPN